MPRPASQAFRLGADADRHIEETRDAIEAASGIRPDRTAVIRLAVEELHRRKVGRRAADARPIKDRRPGRRLDRRPPG